MKKVEDYLRLWQLKNPRILAETRTSIIYLVHNRDGNKLVLKYLKPEGYDEIGGAQLLKWYAGHAAVTVFDHDDGAHLLEYVPGPWLKAMVEQGQDHEATEIIVDVAGQLLQNRVAPAPGSLVALQERFEELFNKAEIDKKAGRSSLFINAASMAETLLSQQTEVKPLHGDLHHENILHADRGWLAIDPKGLIGDPCYEFANIFCDPDTLPAVVHDERRIAELAKVFSNKFSLDIKRILRFAFVHACLSASWNICENRDPSFRLKVAELTDSVLGSI